MNNNIPIDVESCNTLYRLLEQCEVRIPIIQRDYAQGRNNAKANEVRKRLLDDIIHVFKNNKQLDFNFIYGNKTEDIFYPVDGQQRLTTLYLLHWFLACRAGEDHLKKFNALNKFSYMTRNSASEFFTLLKNPNDELCSLIKTSGNLIEKITDYAWFRAEWNNDPTVISALNMINDMSNKVDFESNEVSYYKKLLDADFPAIYFKVLTENGKNAETAAAIKYIRMNARGKVLTTFENVKAMLDGIDEKLKDGSTKIIFDYDTSFIDIFYNKASEKYEDMDAKTEAMDKQTMCFFRNMYNVAAIINGKNTFHDDTSYANEMYRYSQGELKGNEKFFAFYFNMMEAVLRVRKVEVETEKFIDKAFNENFCSQPDYRNHVAFFLYLYYLYIKHIESNEEKIKFNVAIEKMKKFDYILINLMYLEWEDDNFIVINKLAKEVAETVDVFDYFESNSPERIIEVIKNSSDFTIGLSDIKQRIKEQHIKAKIIVYKKYNYDYFNLLEEKSQCRKIQYLLWISKLWEDNYLVYDLNGNDIKIEVLEKYMKIASRYFMASNKVDELNWRKLFAIGGNWDETSDTLIDSDTININTRESWEKHSYWDDNKYFWNDSDMPDIEKLRIVKLIYDLINKFGESELVSKVKHNLDNTCWLKYAILKNHKELLVKNIRMDNDKILEIYVDGTWRRFMPYVLLLDQGYSIVSFNYAREFGTNKCFGGFGICYLRKSSNYNVITLEANKTYTHTNRKEIFKHNDWRNYNITLEGAATVKFTNISQSKGTVCIVDQKYYKVYQYQEDSNDFTVQFYNLADIQGDIKIKFAKIKVQSQEVINDVSNGNFDTVLEIKNDYSKYWKRMGNSRTWTHTEVLEYGLKKGDDFNINFN